jgi:hypothetical protein
MCLRDGKNKKLSLCKLRRCLAGTGVQLHSLLISALGWDKWWASRFDRFNFSERITGNHWTGGWVDARACLPHLEKRKSLTLEGIEPRSVHPTAYSLCNSVYDKNFFIKFEFADRQQSVSRRLTNNASDTNDVNGVIHTSDCHTRAAFHCHYHEYESINTLTCSSKWAQFQSHAVPMHQGTASWSDAFPRHIRTYLCPKHCTQNISLENRATFLKMSTVGKNSLLPFPRPMALN